MRRLTFLLLLAVAVPAAPALAGGWATVELGTAPGGLSTDKPWRAELIVKQHGITPLDGLAPSVRIRNADGVTRTFRARPAGEPGTYVAVVRFPSAGEWRTRIFDGFTDATPHRLSPLTVAPAGEVGPPAYGAQPVNEPPPATPSGVGPADGSAPVDDLAPATALVQPDDGGLPWPQIVAIGLLVLLWLGAMAALGGPRLPRRRAPAPRLSRAG